jgi:hypothetical protein
MFAHVSVIGVILAAASAMVVGTLWYSPVVFGRQWMRAIGLSDKEMGKRANVAMPIMVIISLLTAYVLSLFTIYFHSAVGGSWWEAGINVSLLVWLGFALTTIVAHGVFEPRDKKVVYINAGNRLVTLFVMGLIIAACLK